MMVAGMTLNASWRSQIHDLYPAASHVALYDDLGQQRFWTERHSGLFGVNSPKAPSRSRTLHAVLDEHAFVWPPSRVPREVFTSDGTRVTLRSLSRRPHVLLAEGVIRHAEREAIRRLASPRLQQSTTTWSLFDWFTDLLLGQSRAGAAKTAARTSSNAWIRRPRVDAREGIAGEDDRLVRAAWDRVASLMRLDPDAAEPMQVVRYGPGQHYVYHLDHPVGSRDPQAWRHATALFYLNEGFEGGCTNWPMVSRKGTMHRVQQVLGTFNNCQTEHGLTVKPRAGSVVLFYNLLPNSLRADYWPWHASCDVGSGEKWAANLWFKPRRAAAAATSRKRRRALSHAT